MPNRRLDTLHIRTLLQYLRASPSDRHVSRDTGLHRETIRKYRQWALEHHLLDADLPEQQALEAMLNATLPLITAPQNKSSVEPYRDHVKTLLESGTEIRAIYQRLNERGYNGTYSSVYRFARSIDPIHREVVCRVETPPGYEAQVDFGDVGTLFDEKTQRFRRAYAFVMVLSFSRYIYVEFVFDQKAQTWVRLHQNAFAFFGGVPQRIVLDNLKAGIIKVSVDEPVANHVYHEAAEHYGFLIAPCRPATPQHKGKTENAVHYVQRNFLGGREKTPLQQTNIDALTWCRQVGERIHGTTKKRPIEQFQTIEAAALRPLPQTAFDCGVSKELKLHRDCHLVFEGSYYSAPFRLVQQTLRLRAGVSTVRIYTLDHQLIATHDRASEPGQRYTHPDHLPTEKTSGLLRSRERLMEEAQAVGESTKRIMEDLLSDPVIDRTATAGRLLRLAQSFSDERLEAACGRALVYQDGVYATIKRILSEGLDEQSAPTPPQAPPATTFVRSADEIFGEVAWM